jgi:hypothetical protein
MTKASAQRTSGRAAALVQRQAGQVLLAAVFLLLASVALLLFMVNAGQATVEKTRLNNAADAAAYSAAVIEARALNFDAHLNRAMVANQIVIAQHISLMSWARYAATAMDNIWGTVDDLLWYLAPESRAMVLTGTFAVGEVAITYYTSKTPGEWADYLRDYVIGPGITVHDALVQVLSLAQEAVHLNLLAGVRQWQVANDVVKSMDPDMQAEVVLTSHDFDGLTKRYSKSGEGGVDERGRFADVTVRSRDAFTRERNWTIEGADIPLLRRNAALKKRGGTDLVGYDEWRGVDTLELHGEAFKCTRRVLFIRIPAWCNDVGIPIGWGGVNVNAGGGDVGRGHHGNAYSENGRTASRADSDMEEPAYYNFSGMPEVRELKKIDPEQGMRGGITIMVKKSHEKLMTSGGKAAAKPSGDLELFNDRPAGSAMISLARGEVFFDRIARRADGKAELGSLYNPYWRARLVAPTAGDKAYAAARQELMVLP